MFSQYFGFIVFQLSNILQSREEYVHYILQFLSYTIWGVSLKHLYMLLSPLFVCECTCMQLKYMCSYIYPLLLHKSTFSAETELDEDKVGPGQILQPGIMVCQRPCLDLNTLILVNTAMEKDQTETALYIPKIRQMKITQYISFSLTDEAMSGMTLNKHDKYSLVIQYYNTYSLSLTWDGWQGCYMFVSFSWTGMGGGGGPP